jgi:hypothetical protein
MIAALQVEATTVSLQVRCRGSEILARRNQHT